MLQFTHLHIMIKHVILTHKSILNTIAFTFTFRNKMMREQKNSVQQKYAELIMVVVLLFTVGMMIWLMADNNQNTIKTDKIPTPEQISNKRITDTQSEIKLPKNNQSALQPKPLRKHENNSLTLNSPTTNSQISGINISAINSAKAGTMYDDGDSIYIKERGNNCLWRVIKRR